MKLKNIELPMERIKAFCDRLQRVCTVSVKTMAIVQQMPNTVNHQA